MILKSLKRINLRKTILNYIFLIFICIATIFFIKNVKKYGNNFEYNLKYLILYRRKKKFKRINKCLSFIYICKLFYTF